MHSLRVILGGTRSVMICSYADLKAFMTEKQVPCETHKQVYDYVLSFTESRAAEFKACGQCIDGGKIYYTTQGPGEALFIPVGFINAERVINNTHVYGVKFAGIFKGGSFASKAKERLAKFLSAEEAKAAVPVAFSKWLATVSEAE